MNIFETRGAGNIAKGKLKQRFAHRADDDLPFMEGEKDELFGRTQKRTAQVKSEITHAVRECCAIKPFGECSEGKKR